MDKITFYKHFKSIKKFKDFGFVLHSYKELNDHLEFEFIKYSLNKNMDNNDNESLIIKYYRYDNTKNKIEYSLTCNFDYKPCLPFDIMFKCYDIIYEFINEIIACEEEAKNE